MIAFTFTVSALVMTMIISYIIPAITSLLTKLDAESWVKQAVTALLAAINGVVTAAIQIDGSAAISSDALLLALGSFIVAEAAYLSLYKPHNANAKLLPLVGVG
jgi:hypothetical protein